MTFGNPALGPRIVPFGVARTAADVLPNGRPAFRITQRYGDWDAFFRDRIHGATDIGNFYCGDSIIAMDGGWASLLRDPNGALGVRLRHANGWHTEYWHLGRALVSEGQWASKGQPVGSCGNSGLDIGGCHCHIKMQTAAGVWVDPAPYFNRTETATRYIKFNTGVDGVRLRTAPDARKANIYATVWKAGTGIGCDIRKGVLRDGPWIGNTEARRTLYAYVIGPDGMRYCKLKLAGTGIYTYVQSQFTHRV